MAATAETNLETNDNPETDDTSLPTPGELEEALKSQFPSDVVKDVSHLDIREPVQEAPAPSEDDDTSADEQEPAGTEEEKSASTTPSATDVDPIVAAGRALGIPGDTAADIQAFVWQRQLQAGKPDEPSEKEDAPAKVVPFEHGLDPEEFDSKLLDTLNRMNTHWQKQFDALQQSIAPVTSTVNAATQEMRQQALDAERQAFHAVVGTLNDQERFGTGAPQNGSAQGKNFERLWGASQVLKDLYQARRLPVPSLPQRVNQAYYAEFGEELVKAARENARAESEKAIRKQKTLRTARPRTGSNNANLSADDQALRALTEKMREKNMIVP